MRNRPFNIPIQKSRDITESFEWGDLKNKFSGKTLFNLQLYNLVTGDLSAIDTIENKWFFNELFEYSRSRLDFNLIPALKRIAGSVKFDESLRQKASEIAETIEENIQTLKSRQAQTGTMSDFERATHARLILSGTRYPQTAEVLKLLREKSTELKRLALYMIGNFKLSEMTQEVCECIDQPGLQEDAFNILLSFGSNAIRELDRFFLRSSGNLNTRKTVLRLLTKIRQKDDKSFLLDQLWSNSRQIKEMVVETLLASNYRVNKSETERLKKHIVEVFETIAWIISGLITLIENDNRLMSAEMEKELNRWKDYLFNLLILTFNHRSIPEDARALRKKKDDPGRYIPDLMEIVFDDPDKNLTGEDKYLSILKKKHRKLQPFFPDELPDYEDLLEHIINCDYNLLSIWTKACALRSINKISEKNLGESVVALLFSPGEILFEEAARLVNRSGLDLYRSTSDRIPDSTRKHLDKVLSQDASTKELVYEKTRFLSSCFRSVNEEEVLFLAERTLYVRNDSDGLYFQPTDTILWSFTGDGEPLEVIVNHEDISDPAKVVKDIRNRFSYCYILPLNAVKEFSFHFPESSFGIFKYIDKSEFNL